MRAILDTSVLLGSEVPRINGELSISVASLAELHFGVLVARDAHHRAERLRWLSCSNDASQHFPSMTRSYGATASSPLRWRVSDATHELGPWTC
jgi:toxin FitB